MIKKESLKVIPDFLDSSALFFPNKVALIFEEKEYTYREIKEISEDISNLIIEKTKKGDVVGLLSSNVPEVIFSYFGILKAGCVVLLIPSNISDENFSFQIRKTNPKIIISEKKHRTKIERTKICKKIQYIDIHNFPASKRKRDKKRKIKERDVSTIIFTSGTTGNPKGIKLEHSNVVCATKNIINFLKWDNKDIDINASAISHSFGIGNIHCVFAIGGTSIIFRDTINLKKILDTIIKKKATVFSTTPTTLMLIVENFYKEFKKCDKCLRFIQTNMFSLENKLISKIFSCLPNTDFNYYYGLAEASRSTFIKLNNYPSKIGSVGRASPGVRLKIIDERGNKVLKNKTGEICIKGRHVIKGYWKNPDASKKIKNGWLYTGDMGYLDEDNFLYFEGRRDDIINVSGEKVSPREIEEVVKEIGVIKEAVAVGIPDKLLGQVIKLFVVIKNSKIDNNLIIKKCREKLENYKIPRQIEVVKEIPKTENGKIKRNLLRKFNN